MFQDYKTVPNQFNIENEVIKMTILNKKALLDFNVEICIAS